MIIIGSLLRSITSLVVGIWLGFYDQAWFPSYWESLKSKETAIWLLPRLSATVALLRMSCLNNIENLKKGYEFEMSPVDGSWESLM